MISINQLDYSYSRHKEVFTGLDVRFEKGKIYGLLGKNGMGKSTLLKLIAGYLYPVAGSIKLNGNFPADRNPRLMEKIFFLSEDFLLPSLSISTYLKANSPFYSLFDRNKFEQILTEFDLDSHMQLKQLSYGQKKKFLLAFGLATRAEYLLLDEPSNGLDIPSKGEFRRILAAHVGEEQTVIISTHQIRDLENLLDAIVIIDEGEIILSKDTFEIENKVLFTATHTLQKDEAAIYAERIPGGYMHVSKNEQGLPSQLEIETFFNAVIQHKQVFSDLFNN